MGLLLYEHLENLKVDLLKYHLPILFESDYKQQMQSSNGDLTVTNIWLCSPARQLKMRYNLWFALLNIHG